MRKAEAGSSPKDLQWHYLESPEGCQISKYQGILFHTVASVLQTGTGKRRGVWILWHWELGEHLGGSWLMPPSVPLPTGHHLLRGKWRSLIPTSRSFSSVIVRKKKNNFWQAVLACTCAEGHGSSQQTDASHYVTCPGSSHTSRSLPHQQWREPLSWRNVRQAWCNGSWLTGSLR